VQATTGGATEPAAGVAEDQCRDGAEGQQLATVIEAALTDAVPRVGLQG
jgi:hypothetical protein